MLIKSEIAVNYSNLCFMTSASDKDMQKKKKKIDDCSKSKNKEKSAKDRRRVKSSHFVD
jgi:hypothetical protein